MPSNNQLILILIFLGISGISWVARKLQEKAAERDADLRRKKRQEEYLRTGRTDDADGAIGNGGARPVDTADAQARLRELAAKRQAQLRELRQRPPATEARSSTPAEAPAAEKPQTVRVEMWPGGPVFELGPTGPGGPAGTGKPGPVPAPGRPTVAGPIEKAESTRLGPAAQQSPQQFAEANRKRQAKRAREADEVSAFTARRQQSEDRATEKTKADRLTAADAATRTATRERAARAVDSERLDVARGAFRPPTTPAAWRNALILGEILGPPVALRDQPHTR